MRGGDDRTGELFSYVDLEARVRRDHPLRTIRAIVNEALSALERDLAALYSPIGRPSIPPEKLLRAMVLQASYSIRSERQASVEGRCRMHGARGGAPEGKRNGNYKHGARSREVIALRKTRGPEVNPKNKRKRRAFLLLIVALRQRLNSHGDVVFAGNRMGRMRNPGQDDDRMLSVARLVAQSAGGLRLQ